MKLKTCKTKCLTKMKNDRHNLKRCIEALLRRFP